MNDLSITDLKEIVLSVINDTPDNYRCYETMRVLKSELSKRSIKVEVKDGCAFYYFSTFFREARMGNCNLLFPATSNVEEMKKALRIIVNIAERASLKQNLCWRIPVRHSWAILPEEKYLIDCHALIVPDLKPGLRTLQRFPILKGIKIKKLIRVIPLKKIPSDPTYSVQDSIYWEMAVQQGNTIHYPKLNYSVELRCAEKI